MKETKQNKTIRTVSYGDVDKTHGSDSVKGTTGTSRRRGCGLFGWYWGRFRWWSMIWTIHVFCHHGYGQAEQPPVVAAWLVIEGDPHLGYFLLARFSNSLHWSSSSLGGELAQRRGTFRRQINLIQWLLMGRGRGWVRLKPIYNLQPISNSHIRLCA